MLSLEETLEQQQDLDKLCGDRPLHTKEIFGGNAFYGDDYILKLYAGLPLEYPLKFVVAHGVALNNFHLWEAEIHSILPTITYKCEERKQVYQQASDRYNLQKILIPLASPFIYLSQLIHQKSHSERKGTIFFPAHSTHHITVEKDWEKLAIDLSQLDAQYKPITICIYWKDYLLGRHIPFQKQGFKIVSAGHMFDPNFLVRFYHLCSTHYYAASNELGTNLFYSIQAGCSYFYWDKQKYSYHASSEIIKRDSSAAINKVYEAKLAQVKTMFTEPQKNLSRERLDFLEYYLGKQYFLSPEDLKDKILEAEQVFCRLIQRNFSRSSSASLPPTNTTQTLKNIIGKLNQDCNSESLNLLRQLEKQLQTPTKNIKYLMAIALARLGEKKEAILLLDELLETLPEHLKAFSLLTELQTS